jgi:hypothetical protein
VWTDCIWLRIGTTGGGGGCYEHCNELSDTIKCREFFDQLSDY